MVRGFRELSRRAFLSVIAAGMMVAMSPAARAATADEAVAHIKAMYAVHAKAFAGKAPSVFLGGKEGAKWFAKAVAAKMAKVELGFDPIYDGQDAEISDLKIRLDPELKISNGTAHVKVTFKNFGQDADLTYLLSEQDGAWRIYDIKYGSGSSLSQMLKEGE